MNELSLNHIEQFFPISETIGTSGQPTEAQFTAIQAAGYELVINLLPPTQGEALPNEREIVTALGMEYVSIPVFWNEPSIGDIEQFFEVMEENRGRKVYVHCAANKRASTFLFLYRTLRQQMARELALQDLNRIWTPNPIWQRFIEKVAKRYACNGEMP